MKRILTVAFVIAACSLGRSVPATATPVVAWPTASNAQADDAVIKAIPAAPTNLMASNVQATQLTLSWTPGDSNATQFNIEGKVSTDPTYTVLGPVSGSSTGAIVTTLQPATTYNFRVRASNSDGFSPYSNVVTATTQGAAACSVTSTNLCLFGGRFEVTATWQTATSNGTAQVVQFTDDTGYLWFFAADNAEVLLKIIDGCSLGNHFWFFAGGLTNVRVVITVTDTNTHVSKVYTNPLNTVFSPIQDTSAFPCP